jgi:hypothetical protein
MADEYPPYPQQPNYGAPQQPNDGVQQQPYYGAPQQPNDGVQQQPYYGAPQQPYYGAPQQPNYGPPPENHLVWAILSTVMCCLPLGIVSIVKSNQVNTLWYQGFPMEARKAAEDAKKWAMWSAITVGILVLLYVIFIIVMIAVVGTSASHLTPLN